MVASTIDLWTDNVNKNSFLSVTAHYIDEEFSLKHHTLCVTYIEGKHTTQNVISGFKEGITKFVVSEEYYKNIVVVLDSGSNCCGIEGIPSEFSWLSCLDHKIATALTTIINKTMKQHKGKKSAPFYMYVNTDMRKQ